MNRGNTGVNVFRSERDREKFLEYLGKAAERYYIKVHTYCLMGKHYHLLLEIDKMKILVVTAHPLKDSLCGLFSEKVIRRLDDMGHEVQLEDLYRNQFDPVLSIEERISYYKESYASSKVTREIERLVDSDALVMIFPTWWFGFPAILKGWFDRVWAPTVAYDHANDYGPIKPKLHNLKKAFVVTTLGAPWWVDYIVLWRPVKRIVRLALLGACARKCRLKFISFYKCESVDSVRANKQICEIESELTGFFKDNSTHAATGDGEKPRRR
jgi:putative NADPH-quinone reductase